METRSAAFGRRPAADLSRNQLNHEITPVMRASKRLCIDGVVFLWNVFVEKSFSPRGYNEI